MAKRMQILLKIISNIETFGGKNGGKMIPYNELFEKLAKTLMHPN
jgi:hypothetical protein